MTLNDWFNKGMTSEAYMETLDKHKEAFHHIYKEFQLPNDEQFFDGLKEKNLRALVLAEPWCGHCMLDIRIMLHITKKANMPIKFLLRDENLELMDQYLTNGKSRTIPIMIFINENGQEVAKWGPIAPKVKEFVSQYRKDLPEKDSPDYEEKFQTLIQITGKAFREDEKIWQDVYDNMKETLETI